jgi:low affinity Fe/Cu permease
MTTREFPTVRERFNAVADRVTSALGSLPALMGSVVLVVVWALTGPLFHFSDTWQLFINTTTTVVTFWMVFVIQASANRQAKATQLKLDEIIRAIGEARNEFIALDHATDERLEEAAQEFETLSEESGEARPLTEATPVAQPQAEAKRPAAGGRRRG